MMRDLHAARPVTIILVTHDLREAAFLADRIFCMSARPGRIIAERRVTFPTPAQPGGHLHARVHRPGPRSALADRHREAGRMSTGTHNAARSRRRPTSSPSPSSRCGRRPAGSSRSRSSSCPRPASSPRPSIDYWWQLLFHSFHTLWMTVAGFGIAVVFGILLGIALGASRIVNAGTPAAAGRLQRHPQGRGRADPDPVVRGRLDPAGHDGVPDLVLPDRGQCRDRPLHHRAGAGGRHEGAGREEVGHHGQDRHPALDALPVRLAEGGHHARLRRLGDRRVRTPRATASAI